MRMLSYLFEKLCSCHSSRLLKMYLNTFLMLEFKPMLWPSSHDVKSFEIILCEDAYIFTVDVNLFGLYAIFVEIKFLLV